jgi:hypothetical protein
MMIKKILDHMDNLRNGKINKKVESSKALIKSESKKCRQMLNSGSCRNLLKIWDWYLSYIYFEDNLKKLTRWV